MFPRWYNTDLKIQRQISWSFLCSITWGEKWLFVILILEVLKEVQFIWNFLWQDNNRRPLNTGDCMDNTVSCFKLSFHKLDTYIYVYSRNQIKSSLTCKFSSFFFLLRRCPPHTPSQNKENMEEIQSPVNRNACTMPGKWALVYYVC